MKPYYEDNHIRIFNKDCRDMSELPDGSVQCVVTSPPYFGLRKYSGEQELVWGDDHCEHQWQAYKRPAGGGHPSKSAQVGATKADVQRIFGAQGAWCSLCGAWKGQLGLEPTMDLYLQHTIEILREIRRVLRKDGVVFWNIGDSYASGKGSCFNPGGGEDSLGKTKKEAGAHPLHRGNVSTLRSSGLKPKDLCLIPFRVALAAQEDGWWVRSVIIWSKPNPMPESVTDRPTESHEYILMLTKSGKSLYWTHRDGGGTRQKPKADYRWVNQIAQEEVAIEPPDWKVKIKCPECEATGKVSVYLGLDVWQTIKCPTCNGKKETQLWKRINLWRGHDYYWDADAVREPYSPTERWGGDTYKGAVKKGTHGEDGGLDRERSCFPGTGRNLRSVCTFPTVPFPSFKIDGKEIDHFAVFPEKLPQLCIKAATPEVGCCSKCGAPWVRVVEKKPSQFNIRVRDAKAGRATPEEGYKATEEEVARYPSNHPDPGSSHTVGWRPSCKCNAPRVPSLVLDPLMGAGTTLQEAKSLNRYAAGYELSEEYCQLTVERCRQQVLV